MYKSFTMETILAAAFGRAVEVQRGESNSLTKAAAGIFDFARVNRRLLLSLFSEFLSVLAIYLLASYIPVKRLTLRGTVPNFDAQKNFLMAMSHLL